MRLRFLPKGPSRERCKLTEASVVWVFMGGGGSPAGVFTLRERAETWIRCNSLSGTLTAYPLDIGIYDWTIERGYFRPKRDDQKTPQFIGRFSSAYQEHYHFTDGMNADQVNEQAES